MYKKQFTLRFIAVFVGVFCAIMAVISHRHRAIRAHERSLNEVKDELDKIGAYYRIDASGRGFLEIDLEGKVLTTGEWTRLLPRISLAPTKSINLNRTTIDDTHLLYLKQWNDLQVIYVADTNVTESGIRRFKHCMPHVEVITVANLFRVITDPIE
jgi:hypothetical protein